ncbi:MAG: hypothetical protein V7676_07625 [Parasphingorhabdus sp.]|uniref:hypothetical protein n=1 Tax=Parasphingorhabdus sp. TaxID=2709688 RepID=UPI0030021575
MKQLHLKKPFLHHPKYGLIAAMIPHVPNPAPLIGATLLAGTAGSPASSGVPAMSNIRAGIGGSAKVTLEWLFQRIRSGRYRPALRAGLVVRIAGNSRNSALLSALAQLKSVTPQKDDADAGQGGHGK